MAGKHDGGRVWTISMAVTRPAVRDALCRVIDPELGINIVDLGLVYGIDINGRCVRIAMTMTSAACPLGAYLRDLVDSTVRWHMRDVDDVVIALVWDPPWRPEMMSERAQHQLTGVRQ